MFETTSIFTQGTLIQSTRFIYQSDRLVVNQFHTHHF